MITFRSRFCNISFVIPAQRRQRILDALREDGAVSIRALAAALETSAVTIRRDLDYLDSIGELTRTHGGALAGQPTRESPYSEKVVQARREKEAIGALAATLVADGDVVVIGPGTTTEVLAKALAQRVGLTVVTNSLLVAEAFGETTGNEVIVTGGTLRASIRALVGEATNHTLRGLNADLTFLSGNGMDAEFGLSTPNMTVADSDRSLETGWSPWSTTPSSACGPRSRPWLRRRSLTSSPTSRRHPQRSLRCVPPAFASISREALDFRTRFRDNHRQGLQSEPFCHVLSDSVPAEKLCNHSTRKLDSNE